MKPDRGPRPETIERLATAVFPSFAMLAGMELNVFTALANGPLTAGQVAAALEVRPARLRALLYALVANGLLTVNGDRFYTEGEIRAWFADIGFATPSDLARRSRMAPTSSRRARRAEHGCLGGDGVWAR